MALTRSDMAIIRVNEWEKNGDIPGYLPIDGRGQSMRLLTLLGEFPLPENKMYPDLIKRLALLEDKYGHVIDAINGPHGLTYLKVLILRYNEGK